MTHARDITNRIHTKDAEQLLAGDVTALTDEQVIQCFDAYASHISYLNADDYGGDWKYVPQFRPGLQKAEAELKRRGLDVPTGYLM
jgi:hypothetical protein